MANVKTYVCLVDVYRRPERQRNTHGRYYVGAKNEKDHKEVKKAVWNGNKFETEDVLHATAPHKE